MGTLASAIKTRPSSGPARIRGGNASYHKPTYSTVVVDRSSRVPVAKNASEKLIQNLLKARGIAFHYEPHEFATGLSGKGKSHIRPDYFVPQFDIYLEITQGNENIMIVKRSKIRGAHRNNMGIWIILIGPNELHLLERGKKSLIALIQEGQSQREAEREDQVA